MFRSYLTVAIRNLLKRRIYFLLNTLGLAIGFCCCLLIFQYVAYETSYDSSPHNANRIARLTLDSYQQGTLDWRSAAVFPAFGPAMKIDFPEVEDYCRLSPAPLLLSNDERDIKFYETKGYYADPAYLTMFNIPVTEGDAKTALSGVDKIMLSTAMAQKYFGQSDPLGKVLVYHAPYFTKVFVVAGTFIPPVHSHLVVDYLISYPTVGTYHRLWGDTTRSEETSWGWYQFYTYLLLRPGTDMHQLEGKLPAFCDRHINRLSWKLEMHTTNEAHLIALKDIHLHSHYMQEAEANGNAQSVSFLWLAALLIIGIAWVNYVNLSTAGSLDRAREVGVRKVMGASRSAVAGQFLLEGTLVNLLALLAALLMVELLAPWFGKLTANAAFSRFHLPKGYWWITGLIFTFGTAASTLYPAVTLSSFKPVKILKGLHSTSPGGRMLRQCLIVGQFTASIVLIAGTMVVFRQIDHMRSQPIGANIRQTLVLDGAGSVKDPEYPTTFQSFKAALLRIPGIKSITASTSTMGKENAWTVAVSRPAPDPRVPVTLHYLGIDYDFIPSYEIKLLAGRNFSPDFPSDSGNAIINESAMHALGYTKPEEALGQQIGPDNKMTIVGVVQDYHVEGLRKSIDPQLLIERLSARNAYSVKIEPVNVQATISAITSTWSRYFPHDPFNYFFLDEAFDRQYKQDKQFGIIFSLFAFIAIGVACVGLLGLTAYDIVQRRKEIGIRKVLGASVKDILSLLSNNLLRLVGISFLIALPIARWIMSGWLSQFAYRIIMGWWVFIAAGALAVFIALATISFQAVRAAAANPVDSLKTE